MDSNIRIFKERKVTAKGNAQLRLYRSEWQRYCDKISLILREE